MAFCRELVRAAEKEGGGGEEVPVKGGESAILRSLGRPKRRPVEP